MLIIGLIVNLFSADSFSEARLYIFLGSLYIDISAIPSAHKQIQQSYDIDFHIHHFNQVVQVKNLCKGSTFMTQMWF